MVCRTIQKAGEGEQEERDKENKPTWGGCWDTTAEGNGTPFYKDPLLSHSQSCSPIRQEARTFVHQLRPRLGVRLSGRVIALPQRRAPRVASLGDPQRQKAECAGGGTTVIEP